MIPCPRHLRSLSLMKAAVKGKLSGPCTLICPDVASDHSLITCHYWLMRTIIHTEQKTFIISVICFSVKTNGFRPSLVSRQESGVVTPTSRSQQKTPAATPKRESPATIAAKEAPGWEKFLGVKSQTVSFTSEEATKFRTARDESRNRTGGGAKREEERAKRDREDGARGRQEHHRDRSRQQHIQRRDVLNNFFHKMEENNRVVTESKTSRQLNGSSENQITPRTRREEAKSDSKKYQGVRNSGSDENHNQSSASPEADKQQTLHLSRERSLKSISNWWKNSLETGPSPPHWSHEASSGDSPSPRHNHSHSDSGISSMSGRSSCMSPMSELSSSSGSSRTSLRSSSIVSASNIVLEEEGEAEMEYTDLCRELLLFAASDSRIVGLISKWAEP